MDDGGDTRAKPRPATAYSYIRLSSKRQASNEDKQKYRDGFSRQVRLREEYLTLNPHLTLDTTFNLHDIGVSGFTRENLAKGGRLATFKEAVDEGRVAKGSYLLVESLDRFSRAHVSIAQQHLLALVNAGIVVVSLTDKMTYRADDDSLASQANFMFSVMTLMRGHEESRMKSIRLQETWDRKRSVIADNKLTGRAPAWLDLVDGRFVENEGRVRIVRKMLRWLVEGFGRDTIARFLNEDPDKDARPWGHGTQWHGGTVQKVTDNRALIGEFQPHKMHFETVNGVRTGTRVKAGDPIPDYYPRVIDEDLWAAARAAASKRSMKRAANSGGRQGTVISNLFGMVATCALCGKPMNYRDRGDRSTPVLRCSGERSGNCTNAYRIPYDDNQNAILGWLVTLDLTGGSKGEIARLDESLRLKVAHRAELLERGSNIVRNLAGMMEFAEEPLREIAAKRADLDVEIADLGARLTHLRAQGMRDERSMALAELWRLDAVRRKAEGDEAKAAADEALFRARTRIRQVIRDTFSAMRCGPDGTIDIVTIDGVGHRFRDGYWWNEEGRGWIPWAGSMLGAGYHATQAELRRRGRWLAEFEAACPPRHWQEIEADRRARAAEADPSKI